MAEPEGTATVIQRVVNGRRGALWSTLVVLILVIMVFFVIRLVTDVPNIAAGTLPHPDSFQYRYVLHALPAYLHVVPGVVYLLGAPWQLARRFRHRHLRGHRRLGRVLLGFGLVSGALAIIVGIWFPYGGPLETSAAIVFGVYFLTALTLAYRAVRRRDITSHRRWMIRAFAIALGVGTIRIWVGLFQLVGLLAIQDNIGTHWFGAAFVLALVVHAAAAEAYLRARPTPAGTATSTPPRPAST